MGLITDIFRRVRPARFEEAEEASTAERLPLNKQKKESSKKKWSFIIAGFLSLCILSFVLLRTYLSPSTTQLNQPIVSERQPSPPAADKTSPEPPKGGETLSRGDAPLNADQTLNRTQAERQSKENPLHARAVSIRPLSHRGKENESHQSKLPPDTKQESTTKPIAQEEVPSRLIHTEQQGDGALGIPVGTVISQGDVKMEVKDKAWKTLESSYSSILKGKKIKIEDRLARISLVNNSLIEACPNSLLSFEHENQLNLLAGGIHFRIPAAAQMNFKIGALSVIKSPLLNAQKDLTTVLINREETRGSLFLHPDGSLRVRCVRGSLSILGHENRVLAAISNEPITIPPNILSGKDPWRVEQLAGVPAPGDGEKFQASMVKERREVDELEKYLVDFSIHLKGKDLPAKLDTQKFFSLLETVYPHPDIIEKVRQYPVKVRRKGESYVLNLCDKQSEWMLYEDLGETTDIVDYILTPEESCQPVRCWGAPPPYWLLTVPAAAAVAGVVVYEVDRHNDHDHRDTIPLCP